MDLQEGKRYKSGRGSTKQCRNLCQSLFSPLLVSALLSCGVSAVSLESCCFCWCRYDPGHLKVPSPMIHLSLHVTSHVTMGFHPKSQPPPAEVLWTSEKDSPSSSTSPRVKLPPTSGEERTVRKEDMAQGKKQDIRTVFSQTQFYVLSDRFQRQKYLSLQQTQELSNILNLSYKLSFGQPICHSRVISSCPTLFLSVIVTIIVISTTNCRSESSLNGSLKLEIDYIFTMGGIHLDGTNLDFQTERYMHKRKMASPPYI
ncbi:hypothetical protein GH733_006614 [Mirounga leonina]|nr:hypothetical protein GH733_006614 [Mirounga leonina]